MAIEVKLPELGDGIESGDILDVLISEGENVEKDQPICEIETDKATVEVPSSHAGRVVKVHISVGEVVPIGSTLITIEAAAEAAAPAPAAEPTTPTAAPPAPAKEIPAEPAPAVVEPQSSTPPPAPPRVDLPAAKSSTTEAPSPAATAADPGQVIAPAGPAIRRLAREVGIDLTRVHGTGPGGRITREDVLAVVRQSSQPPASSSEETEAETDQSEGSALAKPPTTSSTADEWGPIHVERMTKIRKTIARKMHESWESVPRVTNYDDADVTELESIRQASKADYASRGIKLTSMPFLVKAVALALRTNPLINAAIDEVNQQIIFKEYVNLGIAVDTPRGLVVPALRRPDELGIPEIARALNAIADNARNNDFQIEDLRGSTFTISNLGSIGGTYSTPIINVPEVAILLVGRARKMPAVFEDEIAIRVMMPLSLSYDHRLVDGATAARFLNDVKGYLERPSRLLLAP